MTKGFNLVPVVPLAARRGLVVLTPYLMTVEETVGVHTKQDTTLLEVSRAEIASQCRMMGRAASG